MVEEEHVESLIRKHLVLRPLMRATDVYKLLYQGVFGVGHILNENAWNHLLTEASELDLKAQPSEPLIEDVSIDGSMVRVNLRPYMRRGLPLERLYLAMKDSRPEKGVGEFTDLWATFEELVKSGKLAFDEEEIKKLSVL